MNEDSMHRRCSSTGRDFPSADGLDVLSSSIFGGDLDPDNDLRTSTNSYPPPIMFHKSPQSSQQPLQRPVLVPPIRNNSTSSSELPGSPPQPPTPLSPTQPSTDPVPHSCIDDSNRSDNSNLEDLTDLVYGDLDEDNDIIIGSNLDGGACGDGLKHGKGMKALKALANWGSLRIQAAAAAGNDVGNKYVRKRGIYRDANFQDDEEVGEQEKMLDSEEDDLDRESTVTFLQPLSNEQYAEEGDHSNKNRSINNNIRNGTRSRQRTISDGKKDSCHHPERYDPSKFAYLYNSSNLNWEGSVSGGTEYGGSHCAPYRHDGDDDDDETEDGGTSEEFSKNHKGNFAAAKSWTKNRKFRRETGSISSMTSMRSIHSELLDDTLFENAMDGPLGSVIRSDMEDDRYEDITADVRMMIRNNKRRAWGSQHSDEIHSEEILANSYGLAYSSGQGEDFSGALPQQRGSFADGFVFGLMRTKRAITFKFRKFCHGCCSGKPVELTCKRVLKLAVIISMVIGIPAAICIYVFGIKAKENSKYVPNAENLLNDNESKEVSLATPTSAEPESSIPGASVTIPPPPGNLNDLCSLSSISSKTQARGNCEEVCEPALCCSFPSNSPDSCYLWNQVVCQGYTACSVLHGGAPPGGNDGNEGGTTNDAIHIGSGWESLLPPPSNLADTCSESNLSNSSGIIDCSSVCQHGECCGYFRSNDEWDCSITHSDICKQYLPCQTLMSLLGLSAGVSSSSSGIDESSNVDNSFESNGLNSESITSSAVSLNTYSSSPPPTSYTDDGGTLDKELMLVGLACSPDHVNSGPEGRNDCNLICGSRSCCFDASPTKNCRSDNKNWCQKFTACEILVPSHVHIPASESMEELCTNAAFVTHGHLEACENSCKDAVCCFALDGCTDTQGIDCEEFAYCDSFVGVGKSSDSNASTNLLQSVCDIKVISKDEEKKRQCQETCRHARCCVGKDGDCSEDQTYCSLFGPCQSVWDGLPSNQWNHSTNSSASLHPPSDFEKSCNSVAIQLDSSSRSRCEEICQDVLCCAKKDGDCTQFVETCNNFSDCFNLWGEPLLSANDKDDPEVVCSESNLSTDAGKHECAKVCEPWACCFVSGSDNCFGQNPNLCRKFEICPQDD